MSYYHVLLKLGNRTEKIVIQKNLTKKQLKKGFVSEFMSNSDLLVDGNLYRQHQIQSVNIIKTENDFDDSLKEVEVQIDEANLLKQGISSMPMIFDFHIERAGNDVTSKFINSAPKDNDTWFHKLTHNPMLVGIISAIIGGIVGAIATWLTISL